MAYVKKSIYSISLFETLSTNPQIRQILKFIFHAVTKFTHIPRSAEPPAQETKGSDEHKKIHPRKKKTRKSHERR